MTTLTPEDRDALRALAEKATPGPWLPHARYVWTSELGGIIQNWSEDANAADDMEFIAAARAAVPALLDMLDQAEAERDHACALAVYAHDSSELMQHKIVATHWAEEMQAERDHARAQVDRVRAVLDRAEAAINRHPAYTWSGQRMDPIVNGADIRRALDGEL